MMGNELPLDTGHADLLERMIGFRADVAVTARGILERFGLSDGEATPELRNLAAYLAIRQHDLRPLQRELMWRGYSSLGRLESRVVPTLDAVIANISALAGQVSAVPAPSEQAFFAGEAALHQATDALFGIPPANRRARIMVTMPSTAATDPEMVLACARAGMNVARINCAHDDAMTWRAMVANIRAAARVVGREIAIFMDVAGPKIRTGAVKSSTGKAKLLPGEALRLVADDEPWVDERARFSAQVSLPEIVTRLSHGDRIRYDDGKLEGVVETVVGGEAIVRVTHAKTGGTKLKPEKGLNLPDTELGLSPLTAKDEGDLATVVECADMIGYSFVSRADDIDLLEEVLARHDRQGSPLGVVAKIELPEAVRNLPALIARVGGRRPFGVMIARGDLAAELGFDRVAEMQEELLWICEAASVPAIWATQVLEDLMKTGLPSRGEMTDAAMAARAECVMLNKGPAVVETIGMLDGLLARMDAHMFKKTPQLRALKSW
ncbi:pyruvate kinase [Amaricoccus macauensis]|uniref:pyruvate kinase n=1 Tax=Amaricoccus macauensis TaxID=57001 RepID=UPI003C7CEFC5